MDKETLSNYGWIVILVLILAVLLALATPFGNFIAGAFKATYAGFGMVGENALGIVIPGQEFNDNKIELYVENQFGRYSNSPSVIEGTNLTVRGTAEASKGIKSLTANGEPVVVNADGTWSTNITTPTDEIFYIELVLTDNADMTDIESGYVAYFNNITSSILASYNLSWTGYDESIVDFVIPSVYFDSMNNRWCSINVINYSAFWHNANIKSIVLPNTTIEISGMAFRNCTSLWKIEIPSSVTIIDYQSFQDTSLTNILYGGSISDWNNIQFGKDWNQNCQQITVTCTDGTITVPAWS